MDNPLGTLLVDRSPDAVATRSQISEALIWVAIWVFGLVGLTLGAFALLTEVPRLLAPAGITILIGVVGAVQRAMSRPNPSIVLVLGATGAASMVPVVGTAGHVVILPVLIVLGTVGALALPYAASIWFASWCAFLGSLSLFWVLPEAGLPQIVLAILLLCGAQFGAWRFVSIASQLLVREEQSHRAALETNGRLLEFEHALALCSQALLTGSGEEALEAALGRLREAIDSDRAYLALNVDDPDMGPSFHVIKTASRPGTGEDDWVGATRPWSKYQMVADELAAGRPYRHVATEEPGGGWNRSLLSVPVFINGRWAASVGFIDIARETVWSDEAVRMLQVAAPMLGTFWERETTRRRLEELIESKDRFVASVSHELRTPLAAVLGFAEELRTNRASFGAEELTAMLELIADQSQEMADMVEDLLVSARADIGTVSIYPKDVYLRAQAETVLAGLGSVGGKRIAVVGGRGKVWADPSRTRQILRNLITNAIRYGGDVVTIEADEEGEQTVLTVTDDGPGLDAAHWETIFEPYQRAHDIPTQPASIGLGLTVSRQLARLMGGDLVYTSNEEGSVFALTLPMHGEVVSAVDETTVAGVSS